MRRWAVGLLLGLLAGEAAAGHRIYFVNPRVQRSGNGLDWSTAFKTLPEALVAAHSDDLIFLAPGVYPGGFYLKPGVRLFGGMLPGEYVPLRRRPLANPSILDGQGSQRVLVMGPGAELNGCIVINGVGTAPGGGGVVLLGGGHYVVGCVFLNCTLRSGSGAALWAGKGTGITIENCVFLRNRGGSALALSSTQAVVNNNAFYANQAHGLRFLGGARPRIVNNLFLKQTGFGVVEDGQGNQPRLEDNLFHRNGAGLYRLRGRALTSLGALNALAFARRNRAGDPRLLDPDRLDFRLEPDSPLIDAGQDDFLFVFYDLHLQRRPFDDPRIEGTSPRDIGPVEWQGTRFTAGGRAVPGGRVVLDLWAPLDAGLFYQCGTALGQGPLDFYGKTLFLSYDALFVVSTSQALPQVFFNYRGRLDGQGRARAEIRLPPFPFLKGVTLYTAAAVLGGPPYLELRRFTRTLDVTVR